MKWNYLFIPKLQQRSCWSLGVDKKFHLTLYDRCNYLSMLGLKLTRKLRPQHTNLAVWYIRCSHNNHNVTGLFWISEYTESLIREIKAVNCASINYILRSKKISAAILQTTIFKCIFMKGTFCILIHISLKPVCKQWCNRQKKNQLWFGQWISSTCTAACHHLN